MTDEQSLSTTRADRAILRELARRVAEIAALPEQAAKAELWRRVNRLEAGPPPVLVWLTGAWREVPEDRLQTESALAQAYERDLRRRVYFYERVNDDRVIEVSVPVPLVLHDTGWGIGSQSTAPAEAQGARHYDGMLQTFADLERIQAPQVTVDWDATARQLEAVQELFDGILEAKTSTYWGNNYGCAPMDTLGILRGFEQLFADLVENPAFVHDAMARLSAGQQGIFDQLEAQHALHLNNSRAEWIGTGGLGYTDELPADGFDPRHVRLCDLWGGSAAQIFAPVSPDMHEEFCLRYERPILERFGLVCYGCCEPLDRKMGILKSIRNLRRISMSPWIDIDTAADALGADYIFSWKPNPAIVSSAVWDPEAARRELRDFLARTRRNIREITLKDLETVHGDPTRLTAWLQIAREEIDAAG